MALDFIKMQKNAPLTPAPVQAIPTNNGSATKGIEQNVGNFFSNIPGQIGSAFSQGASDLGQGISQAANGKSPLDFFPAIGKGAQGIGEMLASPFAPLGNAIGSAVQPAVNSAADKIASNPGVQQFAQSPAGNATSQIAQGVANTANTVGNYAGAFGAEETFGSARDLVTDHPMFQPKPIINPDVVNAQAGLDMATSARGVAAQQGVDALSNATDQVGQYKSSLGQQFATDAVAIEQAKPGLTLNLTRDQVSALDGLKETKSFTLPDSINTANGPQATIRGSNFSVSPQAIARNPELANIGQETKVSLSPTQAQDLITQLNRGTFTRDAMGNLHVNQQMVDITNSIKDSAAKVFDEPITSATGETIQNPWSTTYSKYSQGIQAVKSLNDIINLDPNATASDLLANLQKVLKLGKTPEGKIILQNAVDELKNAPNGIDLTDPVKAMHQILDKQIAMEDAQSKLTNAQTQAAKPGLMKQIFNPAYIGRSLVRGSISGVILYPIIRAIMKAASGK